VRPSSRAQPTEQPAAPPTEAKVDAAMHRLDRLGLSLAPRPGYDHPQMPYDVTELESRDLMVLFQQFQAWGDYLAGRLAVAEAKAQVCDWDYTKKTQMGLLRSRGGRPRDKDESMTLAKAEVGSRPEVVEAFEQYEQHYLQAKLLKPMAQRAVDGAAYLSREITRRQGGNVERRSRGMQA
jgi:hypothetical protein